MLYLKHPLRPTLILSIQSTTPGVTSIRYGCRRVAMKEPEGLNWKVIWKKAEPLQKKSMFQLSKEAAI